MFESWISHSEDRYNHKCWIFFDTLHCSDHRYLWGRNNKRVLRRNEPRQGEATGSCVLLACICLEERGCCAPENIVFYFFYAECSAHVMLRICGHYNTIIGIKTSGGLDSSKQIVHVQKKKQWTWHGVLRYSWFYFLIRWGFVFIADTLRAVNEEVRYPLREMILFAKGVI